MPRADELALTPSNRLRCTPLSHLKPERVRWLWRHRIPLGALTLLAGRQGLGKSALTAELAARVSRGELAGDLAGEPSRALLISFEDHASTTTLPRVIAAGGDLALIELLEVAQHDDLTNPLVTLPDDLAGLEHIAKARKARLVIIDPVVASLPSSIDAHRDQDVRRALAPLGTIAERCDLAVLGLIHWNKSATTDALTRISGSTAFSAAARSVLAFGTHGQGDDEDDHRRILAHAKSNLGPRARSVEYKLEPVELVQAEDIVETIRVRRLGECDITPGQLLAGSDAGELTRTEEACAFLRDALEDGKWHSKDEVREAAVAQRIALRTLLRAVNKIGVEFRRSGFPARAQWRLPPVAPPLFEEQPSQ